MALVKYGPLAAAVSGKIGGTVFSRNRGGAYLRTWAMPANPQTSFQTNIRTILSQLSSDWRTLTDAQRMQWAVWASQNPITNAIGERTILSGHQAFVQINHRVLQSGGTQLDVPALASAPDALLTLSVAAAAGASTVGLTFTATPLGAGCKLWILAAKVDSAGIKNVNNLFRLVGLSAAAQASPFAAGTMIETRCGELVENQIVHVRACVVDTASGLLSLPIEASAIVAA